MRPLLVLLATLATIGAAPAADAKGKKYALLIGVTKYQHAALTDLKFPGNDIEELEALLKKPSAGFTSVRVLTAARGQKAAKDAPTAANIKKALEELLAKRAKGDLVLIALSGHGAQLQVSDPDGKGEPRSYPFFCPSDADLLGVNYKTGESKTLVNVNTLFEKLGKSGAGSKLVLIDACRNTLKVQGARRNIDAKNVEVPEGVSVLYSCSPGQVAWETPALGKGHGVFFFHVLEGLRGKARNDDGEVTWDALKSHVRRQVPKSVPVLIGRDAKQVPHSVENSPGESPVLVQMGKANTEEEAYLRALALYHGTGGKVDWAESARLAKLAADSGHAKAQVLLGWMTFYGRGVSRDGAAGYKLVARGLPGLRKAAEGGDANAQVWLGRVYGSGATVTKDEKAAAAWYRKAANQKHAAGQYALGLAYGEGRGVTRDPREALAWLGKAAEQNLPDACNALGLRHQSGRGADHKAAATWFRKGAERGHPECQVNLGRKYLSGQGVAKDEAEAAKWFRKAADANLDVGQHQLGMLYVEGWGVAKDDKEAVRWFRKAAEQNHPRAQNDLGWMYEQGRGVAKDATLAFNWYRKAAERGHAVGMLNVALSYESGAGVKKDLGLALQWYKKSAAKGNDRAKQAVARLTANKNK